MNQKLVILFDGSILPNIFNKDSSRSGIFFVVYNILLELLKREDIELVVYNGGIDDGQMKKIIEIIPALREEHLFYKLENSKIKPYFLNLRLKLKKIKKECNNNWLLIPKLYIILISIIPKIIVKFFKKKLNKRENKINVCLSPTGDLAKFEAIKNYKNIQKYTILHDIIPLILPEYKKLYKEGTWFYNAIKLLNKKDYYFAVSDYTKRDFIKHISNIEEGNITTTLLAASDDFYPNKDGNKIREIKNKYNIPWESKYFFSLCSLEPRKNLLFIIRNFIKFTQNNKLNDVYLILGGSSEQFSVFPKFKEEIDALENKNKIIFTGYIEDEDLSALYSGARGFVFMSTYEGFGLPLLEAMQCGTPCIASNVTSMPEVVEDNAISISPLDDDAMIKSFEDLYSNDELHKELSQKSLLQSKKFSWKKTVDIMTKEMKKNIK